eukprot:TRINITY_DN8786_c0_g6_i1.p1 TRINITY_DN8786_c0_g6~~TRINITY_DN8786_c0_g6_i1.p1  ORF type:complete len:227 (-),score=10.42 TRINITY_DN8786_c0_g6_i1:1077-1757(-)
MRTEKNATREHSNQTHKDSKDSGRYLFSSDFFKTNRGILLKYFPNAKTSTTRVNASNQNNNSLPEANPQSNAVSCTNNSETNKANKSSEPFSKNSISPFKPNNCVTKRNSQKEMTMQERPKYVRSKHASTKSISSLAPNTIPAVFPLHSSTRKHSATEAYFAATHQGLVRSYNEDRVSIVLNVEKPFTKAATHWPAVSFFGLYDGHGGAACAEYLRDHLHYFVNVE